jgi:hypothetical protein
MNDIVPDSEPPQDLSVLTPIRAQAHGISKSEPSARQPAKRPFHEIDPSSEPEANSGEIVPDSILMEEEDEDDIPLASATTKHGPVKGSEAGKGKEKAPVSRNFKMAPPTSVSKVGWLINP